MDELYESFKKSGLEQRSFSNSAVKHAYALEARYGKKFYLIDREKIIEYLNNNLAMNKVNRRLNIKSMQKLIKYCEDNGRCVLHVIDKITADDIVPIKRCREEMFISPTHLDFVLKSLNNFDMNTMDNYYRGIMWLVYIGITPKSGLFDLTSSDILLRTNTITLNGVEYHIFDEAKQSIKWLIEAKRVNCMASGVYDISIGTSDKIFRRIDSEYLNKDKTNERYLTECVGKVKKRIRERGLDVNIVNGINFDVKSLSLSGVFYTVHDLYKDDIYKHSRFSILADQNLPSKTIIYKDRDRTPKNQYEKLKRYQMSLIEDEYQIWKKAFFNENL